ncbi:MAG: GrpB family protein [Epsilonproteobacteria bacterium]|nr:MAG: GrpB family protein [Campylobacterota bacterium]
MKKTVELTPYSPWYKQFFLKECQFLKKILRRNLVEIHHIGSTSIPSILARPILDVLCVVHTLDGIDLFSHEFEKFGLHPKGEYGIPGRRYFERYAKDQITHIAHIHILERSNPKVSDHLDFRDYLNAEPEVAKEYENLKIALREHYPENPELYSAGKNEFTQTVLKNLKQ